VRKRELRLRTALNQIRLHPGEGLRFPCLPGDSPPRAKEAQAAQCRPSGRRARDQEGAPGQERARGEERSRSSQGCLRQILGRRGPGAIEDLAVQREDGRSDVGAAGSTPRGGSRVQGASMAPPRAAGTGAEGGDRRGA